MPEDGQACHGGAGTYKSAALLQPSSVMVRDPVVKEHLWRTLWRLWGREPPQRAPKRLASPCPTPVSLARADLPHLLTHPNDYVVAEKSDGCRYVLMLCCTPGAHGRPVAVMIDRAFHVYQVQVAARAEHFERGTVLDGELVVEWCEHVGCWRQMFLVFDVVAVCGDTAVAQRNYLQRMEQVHALLEVPELADYAPGRPAVEWTNQAVQALRTHDRIVSLGYPHRYLFCPKSFQPMCNVAALWRQLSDGVRVRHRFDGLLFTPIAEPIRVGRHTTQYKWKETHTVDVWIDSYKADGDNDEQDSSDWIHRVGAEDSVAGEWTLVDMTDPRDHTRERRLLVLQRDEACQEMEAIADEHHREHFRVLAECAAGLPVSLASQQYDETGDNAILPLRLINIRRDKKTANTVDIIERTLANVSENIRPDELFSFASSSSSVSSSTNRASC